MRKWIIRIGVIVGAAVLHTIWRESIRDKLISYDNVRSATQHGAFWGLVEGLVVLGIVVWAWRATRDKENAVLSEDNAGHDEAFWEKADSELNTGQYSKGLWAKCFSDSGGDEAKAKGLYLKLRVEQFKADPIATAPDTRKDSGEVGLVKKYFSQKLSAWDLLVTAVVLGLWIYFRK